MCAIYTIEVKVTNPDGVTWGSSVELPADKLPESAAERATQLVEEAGYITAGLIQSVMED